MSIPKIFFKNINKKIIKCLPRFSIINPDALVGSLHLHYLNLEIVDELDLAVAMVVEIVKQVVFVEVAEAEDLVHPEVELVEAHMHTKNKNLYKIILLYKPVVVQDNLEVVHN